MKLRERLAEFERQKIELKEIILFGSYDVLFALKEHPIILSIEVTYFWSNHLLIRRVHDFRVTDLSETPQTGSLAYKRDLHLSVF